MLKRICDRCGREFVNKENYYKVFVESYGDPLSYRPNIDKDLCEGCRKELDEFMNGKR